MRPVIDNIDIDDVIRRQIAIYAPSPKDNPINRIVSSALYAVRNPADVKRKLKEIYIKRGMTRIVKGNIYASAQADIDIKSAIKLADVHRKELFDMISDAVNEEDLLTKAVNFVSFKYAPNSLPFKINNKFLPMLNEGWTFNQALEEYRKTYTKKQ